MVVAAVCGKGWEFSERELQWVAATLPHLLPQYFDEVPGYAECLTRVVESVEALSARLLSP